MNETDRQKTKAALYFHSSSKNHGCEAIIRSTVRLLPEFDCELFSEHPEDDALYGLDREVKVTAAGEPRGKRSLRDAADGLWLRLMKDARPRCRRAYGNLLEHSSCPVALSIGGDNYCYPGYRYPLLLDALNRELGRRKTKTVLWGCSVEPDALSSRRTVEDLKRYSLITVRESLTYRALLSAGVCGNTVCCPDPAFLLPEVRLPLPPGFSEADTVGINMSPLLEEHEPARGIAERNFRRLVEYILRETPFCIALIPHVVEADFIPLQKLYGRYGDSGRVVLIGDHDCMELKGFISRCRFFVGARTHSLIAAYSSCVPAVAVGYSVKARGMAEDIFGSSEPYVVPVQSLAEEDDLTGAFRRLMRREDEVRGHLRAFMPFYCEWAGEAARELGRLTEGKT